MELSPRSLGICRFLDLEEEEVSMSMAETFLNESSSTVRERSLTSSLATTPRPGEDEDPKEDPHILNFNGILVDVCPDAEEKQKLKISLSLGLLVTADKDDEDLRKLTIDDLGTRFLQEFDTVELRSFALDCIIGYIESGRLGSLFKLVAAFGILFHIYFKEGLEVGDKNTFQLWSVMYTALQYQTAGPVHCEKVVKFSAMECDVLSQIFLADPFDAIWLQTLGVLVPKLKAQADGVPTDEDSLSVTKEDSEILVQSLEKKLLRYLGMEGLNDDPLPDAQEQLLQRLDNLAMQRKSVRQEIISAHKDLLIHKCMKELVPEWEKFEKFLEDPRNSYLDEFLETMAHPEPSCSSKEMIWIIPSKVEERNETEKGINDSENVGELGEIQMLMKQAFTETINIHQRKQLIDEISGSSKFVHFHGLTPETIPDLIEYNPTVAIEILLKLMENKTRMKEYLSAMVNMEMSVHSMEVVNRLTSSVDLPREFLYLYISNCIKTCETIDDKYVQNRLVRLLCVFLQSLIRNQIIDIQDIYLEVTVFLLAFSRIREAAALFRLIRHVESEDPELREIIAKRLESNEHLSDTAKPLTVKEKDRKS